jgi:hypothetical protein
LAGGVLILLGAVVGLFITPVWFGGMMGRGWITDNFGVLSPLVLGFILVGFVAGVLVIVGALMMVVDSEQHAAWGVMVLIFSIFSFIGFGIGGFAIGALLGIVGGALALSWRPQPKTEQAL